MVATLEDETVVAMVARDGTVMTHEIAAETDVIVTAIEVLTDQAIAAVPAVVVVVAISEAVAVEETAEVVAETSVAVEETFDSGSKFKWYK